MNHLAFSERFYNIGGDKVKDNTCKGGVHIFIGIGQVERPQIHTHTGLKDHAAQNTKGRGNHGGRHINCQDFSADTAHLLHIGGTGNAHDQRGENEGDNGHLNQVQVSVANNVQHRVDDDVITDIAFRDKAQDCAENQAKDHANDGLFAQGSSFFAFEGCHSNSFFL